MEGKEEEVSLFSLTFVSQVGDDEDAEEGRDELDLN